MEEVSIFFEPCYSVFCEWGSSLFTRRWSLEKHGKHAKGGYGNLTTDYTDEHGFIGVSDARPSAESSTANGRVSLTILCTTNW